ncbi:MAG: FKBP-type peptidyl-prolyl cis-trans isomerase [Bacteroidales bacterium]|nr:FKBP-type peptidyl-prolyl cis-trans isomerase [Bacteroidales bacterium]
MKHKILTLSCALLALVSCGKSSLETTFAKQSENIDKYVTKQLESHPEYQVVYNDGAVRMIVAEGEGTELAKGGSVTFYYAGYNFNNSSISAGTMFATNDPDIAASAKWDLSDSTAFLPRTVTLGKDKLVHGLELGLDGVRSGEDCYIFFSGKHGFGKRQIGTIPANASLCYHVRVEEVND